VIRAEETKEGINRIVKERNPLKPMKEQLRQLPWKLIFILALIQLTRPILSTAGFFDGFRPQGPIIATALIALIWVGAAVIGNVREPVKALAMAGATYAVIGVAMAVFLQTFFTWSPEETASIPLLLTAGLIGGIVVNVIWVLFWDSRLLESKRQQEDNSCGTKRSPMWTTRRITGGYCIG
jgi:hypothetical protein